MTQLVRTGYLLGTSSRRVLFNSASFALDFTTGFYKNAAGYTRTNLALQSDARGTAPWTVQAGAVANADGLSVFTESTASATHNTYQSTTVASGATVTFSANLAAGSRRYVQLGVGNGATSFWITVDTSNWTITEATNSGTSTLTGYALVPVGGGIYRAHVTGALAGQTTYFFAINGTLSAAGGGNAPAYLGTSATIITRGVQFETTSYPTSYIATTTAPASVTTYTSTNPADVGNMTFTRASTGYAEDASGNLVLFGSGVPRITNKGYLAEPAATNLALNSSMGASWGSNPNDTVTPNAVTAPDGTATGTKVTINSGVTNNIYRAFSVTAGTTYTGSLYLKQGAGALYQAVLLFGASGAYRVWLNTQTGALSGASLTGVWTGASATVTAVAGGWFRVALTATVVTDTSVTIETDQATSSGNYTATPGDYFYCWGAQLETGSVATSLIATGATSATRAADVFYYAYTQGPVGTMAVTYSRAPGSGTRGLLALTDGTGNNRIDLRDFGASHNSSSFGTVAGASQWSLFGGSANNNTVGTMALSFAANAVTGAMDGSVIGATASASIPTTSRLYIGSVDSGISQASEPILKVALYPYAANDAQLQSLSSGNFLL